MQDENGHFVGLLLVFRDVSQAKELEQAREELTRMMVHDLRGPLTAVMTSLGLIRKTSSEDKLIEKATSTSTRAVKKLLNMVNDLLDLSRMSEGEIAVDPVIISVDSMIRSVMQELAPVAEEVAPVEEAEEEAEAAAEGEEKKEEEKGEEKADAEGAQESKE